MWKKPWGLTEGVVIGCSLILLGMLLQLTLGAIPWEQMASPLNAIVLLLLLLAIIVMHLSRGRVYLFRWMSTLQAGISALVFAALMTLVLGLTRQVPDGHPARDSFGITDMLSCWPFVLTYLWLMLLVGMVCMTRLGKLSLRNSLFLLNHLGLFLALVAGTLGNADMQRLRMTVRQGMAEWRAVDGRQHVHPLPLAIELHQFMLEEYPEAELSNDGKAVRTPRSFASDVTIHTKQGRVVRDTVKVNKPLSVEGWKIYQYGYDQMRGKDSEISTFELVRDPWLPYVYLGIFMMLAGAVSLLLTAKDKRE